MSTITPRWLTHLMSWVPVEAGIYRLNSVIRPEEVEVQCSNYDEAPLPNTFVDYDPEPREYRLKAVQTILDVHTRIVLTWRGIPIVPSDKVPLVDGKTKFLLLRVGEARQGVIGLFQPGLAGERPATSDRSSQWRRIREQAAATPPAAPRSRSSNGRRRPRSVGRPSLSVRSVASWRSC